MHPKFAFTFDKLTTYFEEVLVNNYNVIPCCEYLNYKRDGRRDPVFINRVDIDLSVKKAERLTEIFDKLNIKATFFIRLHAKEYNPFSFENYRILKSIHDTGHEIGYHSEIIDQAAIWNEHAQDCLKRDIAIINRMFDTQIKGIASHGGMTGLNNLDFWNSKKPSDFGLLYEAYDREPEFNLFHESFYISDSSWTYWKCYKNGVLIEGDQRTLGEHAQEHHQIIYSLIHPETYYENHFYE